MSSVIKNIYDEIDAFVSPYTIDSESLSVEINFAKYSKKKQRRIKIECLELKLRLTAATREVQSIIDEIDENIDN